MVLEGATSNDSLPSSDPFSSSDLPSSDLDPYGDDAATTTRHGPNIRLSSHSEDGNATGDPVYINLDDYQHMIPLFPQLRSDPPKIFVDGIKAQADFMAKTLHRPITQDEANALAFHLTKTLSIASWGAPAGISVGMLFAYRGMKTYRFPFGMIKPTQEGGRFNVDKFFPFQSRRAVKSAWQISRFGAYAILGTIFGQLFFSSYALSVASAGRATDPRMREFNETLKRRSRSGLGKKAADVRREGEEVPGAKQTETYDMARQRRSVQGFGRRQQVGDDTSPTGGAFNEEYMYRTEQPGFMNEQEVRQQADAMMRSSNDRSSASETGSQAQTSEGASPQASRESRQEPSSSSGGSAWDRIRKEAVSGRSSQRYLQGAVPSESAGSKSSRRGGGDSTVNDSFSFSSNEEDRQLANSEAQKDCDQRIVREREGHDLHEVGERWR